MDAPESAESCSESGGCNETQSPSPGSFQYCSSQGTSPEKDCVPSLSQTAASQLSLVLDVCVGVGVWYLHIHIADRHFTLCWPLYKHIRDISSTFCGTSVNILLPILSTYFCQCYHTHTHTPTGTTQVSRYQNGKNQSGFYWSKRQRVAVASAGHVCTLLQTDSHASTSLLKFFTGRMPFLSPGQQCQCYQHTINVQSDLIGSRKGRYKADKSLV